MPIDLFPTILNEPPTLGSHGLLIDESIFVPASYIPTILTAGASNVPTQNRGASLAPDINKGAEYGG